jgi:hypothetical protein
MLVHVATTHTSDNCPAYHPEMLPAMIASMEKLEEVGRELRVKAHALLWGGTRPCGICGSGGRESRRDRTLS